MSLAGDILAAAARVGTFSRIGMHRLLGRSTYATVSRTIQDLTRSGRLVRWARGVYCLPERPPVSAPDGQRRMWRVIRMHHRYGDPISTRTLAIVADVGLDYAKRYLYRLRRRGLVKSAGRERHPDGVHFSPLYRLTAAGSARRETPRYRSGPQVEQAEAARLHRWEIACELAALLRRDEMTDEDRETASGILDEIREILG